MHWDDYDAALFDLDGVLTPTAGIHMRAWQEMFSSYFTGRGVTPAYCDDDYYAHIDGKPRYAGVRSTLESRGVRLPDGDPGDPPGTETVCGLGNAKNALFDEVLTRDGVEPFPGSVTLLDHLLTRRTAVAIVSSSRNARAVLTAAGLLDRFTVVVDGEVALAEGLEGKPSPATFAHAAAALGVPTERSVVVEDAVSGVAAGRAGRFGLVIGVDRGAGADALLAAGADVVVQDLVELVEQ